MELDAMKSLWQAHETELKQVSAVNEGLLQRMISDKSRSALEQIKNTEYMVGSLTLLFFVLFLLMGSKVGSNPEMVISYIIAMTAFVIEFAVSVFKLRYLSRINIGNEAITETARKTQWFHLFIIRERLISIPALFIVAPAVYILVFQWVKHESALDHLPFSIAEIVITLVLGIIFSLIMYRRAYLNHTRSIMDSLREIEEFRSEL